MIEETLPPGKLPPGKHGDGRGGARGAQETSAPPDETHPKAIDPTIQPAPDDGRTLVPGDAPAVAASHSPAMEPTLDAAPNDATLAGGAATQAYHQAAMSSAPKAMTTGASFGHYQLIEPIAKGGMGIVYKARQRNLNRVVAIKMILAGQFADQSDIDRFYAEAEAAAALSHPNIVAIHEIGEVQGQHFFSMDYIEGQSLAELVRENPLRPRRAAEFVKTIAETMQFAHDSGVVHRDLKPANILLDKRQRPLITDFGLAKQVSSQSQRTMAGSIVGTPSYMPPEQASGKVDEIGPWSDLYSTGAILYELLTGRPPFRSASPFETIRQVLETEPLSPRLLNENVPKDLETICLKCLQKERLRRYASEQELADELGRFLRGEPIHARPISQLARFWRLCRRHPVTASAIASAVAILLAASIISSALLVSRTAALKRETAAHNLANERRRQAIAAVNDFFTTVSDETLLNKPGLQPLREKLLTKAKSFFEQLMEQDEKDPALLTELAGAYYRLGQAVVMLKSHDDAVKPYAKAREIQQRLLAEAPNDEERLKALGSTVNAIGEVWVEQKKYAEALDDYAKAIGIRSKLVAANPSNPEYERMLANTYMNAGIVEFNSGNKEAAGQNFEKAQHAREEALKADPKNWMLRSDLAKGYYSLARIYATVERLADAEASLTRSTELFEELIQEQPDDLDTQKRVGTCYRLLGDWVGGLDGNQRLDDRRKWYKRAIDRLKPLAEQNPEVVEYQNEWAATLVNLFDAESRADNSAGARDALERARDIYDRLIKRDPDAPRPKRDLAVTLRELAIEQDAQGDKEQAAANLRKSIELLSGLVKQYPDDPDFAEQFEASQKVVLSGAPSQNHP